MPKRSTLLTASLFAALLFMLAFPSARADLVDDLKVKIDERNKVISDLESEISKYQVQIEKTGAQAKTLKNDIAALELTRKKLSAEIKVLENKIASTNLTIKELGGQISDTELTIQRTIDSIASIVEKIDQEESNTLVETLLDYPRMSVFLDRVESLASLNRALKAALTNLRSLKENLEDKNVQVQGKRRELVTLAGALSGKKKVAEYNKVLTNKLLTDTKNQQSNYQKILEQKVALRNAFAEELLGYESQLKFAIDPTILPQTGTGVLKWPLDSIKITQYFGNTDFAKTHPQAYNGHGHNGIDLKAGIGTPVKAAASGTVAGSGNTDTVCPSASYGKWVLLEHGNGLSTLYAHLSVITVSAGQSVSTGDTIGYSGETGYATGPHLHFTVYATQGVKIMSRKSSVCRGTYTMPTASLNAYLNPLSYL